MSLVKLRFVGCVIKLFIYLLTPLYSIEQV